jgi:flagellar biosynthesis/type III secretory pathway protein FliH
VVPFPWGREAVPVAPPRVVEAPIDVPAVREHHLATLEREAFTKGYAQGERAGAEAGSSRGEAMLQRLTETLGDLATVRAEMIHRTERQMVQLALAIAKRIVQREVSLDPDLLLAMARVALDRLGETAKVTIRLHPEDYATVGAARVGEMAKGNVAIEADARLGRGGCRIESDMGMLDVGIDAQLQEVGRALLGLDDENAAPADAPAARRQHV